MKWLRHAFSKSCFLLVYFFKTCYHPLIIRINPTDGTTESTLQGNINVALVTDETNNDGICMNTRKEISQCGLTAKEDLGSEAEKQKHSEIRSSLGDQISLCELLRTLTEGSESAKEDLGSEAEKQKHSEIRSSLGDQISLCELPRTLTEGSESHGQIKNQRKQNQSVKSNLYVWTCRKSDDLWSCFDGAFTQEKIHPALFFSHG